MASGKPASWAYCDESAVDPAVVRRALGAVLDPEIRRPITDLGMVEEITVGVLTDPASGNLDPTSVRIRLLLTVPTCPLRETLVSETSAAAARVPGVGRVEVSLGVMTPEQRAQIRVLLRGGDGSRPRDVPFARETSTTRVIGVASGKGGVGKSTITANLAAVMARDGLSVGVLDADVHGFSIPRLLGVAHPPTRLDDMILPPVALGVKVISIGSFVEPGKAVVWRGPMLHRALEQFLTDVFWGDLDVLLVDLPPGTGDVAISLAQLVPSSSLLIVTTPQIAAAEVAERAGALAQQTQQSVVGVVENMSWMEMPDGSRVEVFGAGGGALVAEHLAATLGVEVELLAQIPLDVDVRIGGDEGSPAALRSSAGGGGALGALARRLARRPRGLAGKKLSVSPRS